MNSWNYIQIKLNMLLKNLKWNISVFKLGN